MAKRDDLNFVKLKAKIKAKLAKKTIKTQNKTANKTQKSQGSRVCIIYIDVAPTGWRDTYDKTGSGGEENEDMFAKNGHNFVFFYVHLYTVCTLYSVQCTVYSYGHRKNITTTLKSENSKQNDK